MRGWWLRAPEWQLFLAYGLLSGVIYGVGHVSGDWSLAEAVVMAVTVGVVHGGLSTGRAVEEREELRRVAGPEWTTEQIGAAWQAVRRCRLPEDPNVHPAARRLAVLRSDQLHDSVVVGVVLAVLAGLAGVVVAVLPETSRGLHSPWGWAVAAACAAWLLLGVPRDRRRRECVLRLAQQGVADG